MCVSIDNSEIDIVPCRQGFIGISTIQDFSDRGPVQVIEKGSLVKMFEDRNEWVQYMNGFWAHILEA